MKKAILILIFLLVFIGCSKSISDAEEYKVIENDYFQDIEDFYSDSAMENEQKNSIDFIVQLFFDLDKYFQRGYVNEYLMQRIWEMFLEDSDLFWEAVNENGRYGRNAVVYVSLSGAFPLVTNAEWLIMMPYVLLENTPTVEYTLQLLGDIYNLPSYNTFPFQISRILHIFESNKVIFLEAINALDPEVFAFPNWGFYLIWDLAYQMASMQRIQVAPSMAQIEVDCSSSGNINVFLETLHEIKEEILYRFTEILWEERTLDYIRDRMRPSEWVEDFCWNTPWIISSVISNLIGEFTEGVLFHISKPRSVFFPMWRNDISVLPIPSCPIWFMSLLNETVREVVMVDLISFIMELRDSNFVMYQKAMEMLTNPSSVFDPATRETFEMVNSIIVAQR